jgi:cation diffusion facilitator family transporter
MKKHHLGYLEGLSSGLLNILLFSLKLWAGMLTGSLALIADAWHTLSDSLSSALVFIGFWIASKPRDKEHPFGHGQAEQITAIIIGTLLAFVAFGFFKEALKALHHHRVIIYGPLIIIVSAISLLLKTILAVFSIWAGKKINAQSLVADGMHHFSDAFTSLLIIIGAFISHYLWWTDAALSILIAFIIILMAYDIIKKASHTLLGTSASQEMISQIQNIVQKHNQQVVSHLHHLHVHRYGDHIEVTFHLRVPGQLSLEKAHQLASKIEEDLRNKLKIEATIHLEPIKP